MELELLLAGTHCPITGITVEDITRVRARRNVHPPGYYAGDWEVKNKQPENEKPKKEKQVRQPSFKKVKRTPEEEYLYRKACNKRNYNSEKKRQYYLTRKEKLKQCQNQYSIQ
jgi:hypothetical protein